MSLNQFVYPDGLASIFGTAWKGDATRQATIAALELGFLAVDTAFQPANYREDLVGLALADVFGSPPRLPDRFQLQSKYSHLCSYGGRVAQESHEMEGPGHSVLMNTLQESLERLGVDELDLYFLHAPMSSKGIGNEDVSIWRAMNQARDAGLVSRIGLSNVRLDQIIAITDLTGIAPSAIQNFTLTATKWDRDVRDYCRVHSIEYQGYGLHRARIHGNPPKRMVDMAARYGVSIGELVIEFARSIGIRPLAGSSKVSQLQEAVSPSRFCLSSEDRQAIEDICR